MEFMMEYWLQFMLGALTSGFIVLAGMVLALFNGVRALLRDRIIQTYNYYLNKGCCPIYALENVERMYQAYHTLHGNGTVTKLVEELKKLPTGCKDKEETEHD